MAQNDPTPFRWQNFSSYLRKKFGAGVRKIPVDAGFTCPNRDGTKGTGGCTYCNNNAFSPAVRNRLEEEAVVPVKDQVQTALRRGRRGKNTKFMVYFQPFTNTYAPVSNLKQLYGEALCDPRIVGLAVGTRPDCVDSDVLDLLASYTERFEVWLELGLQTVHNQTLKRINRGHTYEDFVEAIELASLYPVKVCVHAIAGLPGETSAQNKETAAKLASFPYHGLKLHILQVLRGTLLEKQYEAGEIRLISRQEFVERTADFLERTPSEVIVQRLTADAPPDFLVAPQWSADKQRLLLEIEGELERRGSYQGTKVTAAPPP